MRNGRRGLFLRLRLFWFDFLAYDFVQERIDRALDSIDIELDAVKLGCYFLLCHCSDNMLRLTIAALIALRMVLSCRTLASNLISLSVLSSS